MAALQAFKGTPGASAWRRDVIDHCEYSTSEYDDMSNASAVFFPDDATMHAKTGVEIEKVRFTAVTDEEETL